MERQSHLDGMPTVAASEAHELLRVGGAPRMTLIASEFEELGRSDSHRPRSRLFLSRYRDALKEQLILTRIVLKITQPDANQPIKPIAAKLHSPT